MPKNQRREKLGNLVVSKPENHKLKLKTSKRLTLNSMERRDFLSLLTLRYKLAKLREKWWQSSKNHCLFKNQIVLKVKMVTSKILDTLVWNCL